MEMVLIIAERTRCDEIKRLFPPGMCAFVRAESETEARRKTLDFNFSLVVVDLMLGISASKDISIFASMQDVDTILLVPEDLHTHFASLMLKYGVYVSVFSRESLTAVFSAICVSRERIRKVEEKNKKLLLRLKNEKLITEAKCLLSSKKGLSESEAHSYIERKAMNCRISLTDAAMSIINQLS